MPIKVTRTMAEEAAAILKCHPWVLGVELFGSVAREGSGNDLDLIIIADDDRGSDFISLMGHYLLMRPSDATADSMQYDMKNGVYADWRLRQMVTREVLGRDFGSLLTKAQAKISWATTDLFVFPRNWRDYLGALQSALPHGDPDFMQNIAKDAVAI